MAAVCLFVACSEEPDDAPGDNGDTGAATTAGPAGGGGADGSNPVGGDGGDPVGSGWDPALARANKAPVGKALDELFVDKDISAVDRYWSEPYLQHNPGEALDVPAAA